MIAQTKDEAKYPEGFELAKRIAQYLFIQRYGELERIPRSDFNILVKAYEILKQSKDK